MPANMVNIKSLVLYKAFDELKKEGGLNSITDAENLLTAFGADIKKRNVIEFDYCLKNLAHKEKLYEYAIPLTNGTFATFYVDHDLGFECGERLPRPYMHIIKHLHMNNRKTQKELH
tara:strand:+ start:58668 stop:59018 length:351 start_codon:yes stop_codon:yes gene_type:complete